ncbi:MAG: hypothetical protein L0Z51_02140 [Candidatus Latescibacteria bacterium]|nr:hypothetical protein [Candidatus Latescibacterota bacterium]
MAKRVNYGFEKRQKEAKRKKKQAEKLEKKRLSRENKAGGILPLDADANTADVTTDTTDGASDPTVEEPVS